MKGKNIRSYWRRYGAGGFINYCFILLMKKVFGKDLKKRIYFSFDLERSDIKPVELEFRELNMEDFQQAAKLDCYGNWFNDRKMGKIAKAFSTGTNIPYGYYIEDKLACYGWLNTNLNRSGKRKTIFTEKEVYLWDDYTAPFARGKGLHAAVIRFRLNKAKEMGKKRAWSDVYSYNKASAKNYLSEGFAVQQCPPRVD